MPAIAMARVRRCTGSWPGRARTQKSISKKAARSSPFRRLSRSASSRPASRVGRRISRSGLSGLTTRTGSKVLPAARSGSGLGTISASQPAPDPSGRSHSRLWSGASPGLLPSERPQPSSNWRAGAYQRSCTDVGRWGTLPASNVSGMASKPVTRATSSTRSAAPSMSCRHQGTVTMSIPPAFGMHWKPRAPRFPVIRSRGHSTPSSRRTSDGSNSSCCGSAFDSPASSIPAATVAPDRSAISCAARSKAIGASAVGSPFSKRPLASLRRPSAMLVRRMLRALKVAASSRIRVVVAPTSLSAPPITPATPTGPLASAITSISADNWRWLPSRVAIRSPSIARRAVRVWLASRSRS